MVIQGKIFAAPGFWILEYQLVFRGLGSIDDFMGLYFHGISPLISYIAKIQ